MARLINMMGKKSGRLTVLSRESSKRNNAMWLCQCDCGNKKIVSGHDLRSGHTRSCGCLSRERTSKINRTHGMSCLKAYGVWHDMIARCLNKKNKSYHNYGGRGIAVCDRWLRFENFYKDMGNPPEGLTLERVDNSKGYFPKNCNWVTQKEQTNNSRKNIVITYEGQKRTMTQWAEALGMKTATLSYRIKHWPIKKAFIQPIARNIS